MNVDVHAMSYETEVFTFPYTNARDAIARARRLATTSWFASILVASDNGRSVLVK